MIDEQAPYLDHAKRILTDEPSLDDHERAEAWDRFHDSKSVRDLEARLSDLDVPSHIVEALLAAKKLQEPPVEPAEPTNPTLVALAHLKKIDPKVLELAERHPTVTASLLKNTK
jgi:hypothetical protein